MPAGMVLLIALKADSLTGCPSFQLLELASGLLQNGDLRVCVFPECEEILIGFTRLGRVAVQGGGAGQAQMRERALGY